MATIDAIADRPGRFGLAAKLFAILLILGAVAVLITSVLGYIRARDALEETIYNQLTAARQSKARQVESYFRTISSELRLLASTKMVVDATREFRSTFSELEQNQIPDELRWQLEEWYGQNFLPIVRRLLGKDVPLADYLPIGPAATYLQYYYIVANPQPSSRRKLIDDAGDGSAYSAVNAVYHPLLRTAAATLGLFDFMIADPKSGRLVYAMDKEARFRDVAEEGAVPAFQSRRRLRPLRRHTRSFADLPGGFCAVFALGRPANRLHGDSGDRAGRGQWCADRAIVDRGD